MSLSYPRVCILVVIGLAVLGACGSSGSQLEIVAGDALMFAPVSLSVPVGTTVRFRNGGSTPHTVTSGASSNLADSPGALFDSQLDASAIFEFTPTKIGDQPYFCRFHEAMGMKGVITVTASQPPPPSSSGGYYHY